MIHVYQTSHDIGPNNSTLTAEIPCQSLAALPPNFEKELFEQRTYLKPFAVHFTRCDHSADDLLQETFLKAWHNRHDFRAGTSLRGWLYAIMKNTFINHYHRKNRTLKRKGHMVDISVNEVGSLGADEISGMIHGKDVFRLLKNLPLVFGQPMQLYIEGYKYKEIADMLDQSIGTIKSRIHFGRKLLKKQLAASR